MTTMISPHAGDYGTQYTFTIMEAGAPVDISSATGLLVILLRPDGTYKTASGTLVNTGSDGRVKYTTVSGDIPITTPGKYSFQVKVTLSPGVWYTTTYDFEVLPSLVNV